MLPRDDGEMVERIRMPDPRFDLALYPVPEAAQLVGVPVRSLWNWLRGYRYAARGRTVRAEPVIHPTARDGSVLSFVNLVEVGVLASFRKAGVSMQKVRRALDYVSRAMGIPHPLASGRILTDGVELFWEYQEKEGEDLHLLNVSGGGTEGVPRGRPAVPPRAGVGAGLLRDQVVAGGACARRGRDRGGSPPGFRGPRARRDGDPHRGCLPALQCG
jgi:hypothetical protein